MKVPLSMGSPSFGGIDERGLIVRFHDQDRSYSVGAPDESDHQQES